MILSAMVAVDKNNAIAKDGKIPWYLPADLNYMQRVTTGHPLIMGRRTHEAAGRTLRDRLNIVISRNPDYRPFEGSRLVGSVGEALSMPEVQSAEEVFVLGGNEIFEQLMPRLDRIYLTRIALDVEEADKFFRYRPDDWEVVSKEKHSKDDRNEYDYEFQVLERKH